MNFFRRARYNIRNRKKFLALLTILLFLNIYFYDESPYFSVSAYNVYEDNSVDSDSDVDATANIGDDGGTSYVNAQTKNDDDQIITEGNGAGYVAPVNIENDIDNDASEVGTLNPDVGTQGTFSNAQGTELDSNYMNIQEGNGAGYVAPADKDEGHDNEADNHPETDLGTYSNNGDNMLGDEGTMETLTEENTGGAGGSEFIGYQSIGGSSSGINKDNKQGSKFTSNIAGTVQNITVYLGLGGGAKSPFTFRCGVYTDSAGTPNTLEGTQSDEGTVPSADAWVTVAWSSGNPTFSATTVYWLVCIVATKTDFWVGTGTTNQEVTVADTYADGMADPFGGTPAYADEEVSVYAGVDGAGGDNYEFDREFSFTGITPLDSTNEELCINTGTMPAESLVVQMWDTGAWTTIVTLVDANDNVWINTSLGIKLDASQEDFRFWGADETGDTTETLWYIDMVLLHIWSAEILDYEIDFEYQWTTASTSETNEEVAINVFARTGTETLNIDYWNAGWVNIDTIDGTGWFNSTATNLATTYTIRIKGTSESGDTIQGDWDINLITLHTWSAEVLDYELEWEHQATAVDEDKYTYNITVYGFASDAGETIGIECWTGAAWQDNSITIGTSEQWYNNTLDSACTNQIPTVTWRFIDSDKALDTTQTVFRIDYSGIAAWNFTVNILTASINIVSYAQGSGNQSVDEGYIEVNVSAGLAYTIQIMGTDGSGSPVTNDWMYFDTDSDPVGATQLSTTYQDVYTNLSPGDGSVSNVYIFLAVPFEIDDQLLGMTLFVRIIYYS